MPEYGRVFRLFPCPGMLVQCLEQEDPIELFREEEEIKEPPDNNRRLSAEPVLGEESRQRAIRIIAENETEIW